MCFGVTFLALDTPNTMSCAILHTLVFVSSLASSSELRADIPPDSTERNIE